MALSGNCDWISPLITPLVAFLSFVLGFRARRPRLIAGGSGSGAVGTNLSASSLGVTNQPTFFGLKIARETAHVHHARLYDPLDGEYVGPVLKWRVDGSRELSDRTAIAPGKSCALYVFVKERNAREYFILEGNALDALGERRFHFEDTKHEFAIVITDEIGRDYWIRVTVRQYPESVAIVPKVTLRHRAILLRDAAQFLLRALSLRR